jgi:hypothetical protein
MTAVIFPIHPDWNWPAGCADKESCARHSSCMYIPCRHQDRDISHAVALMGTMPALRLGNGYGARRAVANALISDMARADDVLLRLWTEGFKVVPITDTE